MKSFCFRKLEFPKFPSFRFWSLYKIENSKNSEIFSPPVNFKECDLLDEVGNLRGFRVFDFGPYSEIENSENSEIFSMLVHSKEYVLLEEVGNFRGFRVFDFDPYTEKSKTWKTRKYFQELQISKDLFYLFYFILFVLLKEFPRFPSFRFWLLY